MTLADDHIERARKNGWSDETIALWGIDTETDPKALKKLLNRRTLEAEWCRRGIVFPLWLPAGARPAQHRFRPDVLWKMKDKNGKERDAKYIGPVSDDSLPIFPPRARANGWLKDPSRPLYITEGEFKTGILDQLGYAALGFCGVSMMHDPKETSRLRKSVLRASALEHVVWTGRTVIIVFDADAEGNYNVRREEDRLAFMARDAGAAEVRLVRIPLGGPKGIDDFFVANGEEQTRALLASGKPFEGKDPASTKDFRVRVIVHEDEYDVTTQVIAAIAQENRGIFTWGFSLAEVVSSESSTNTAVRRPAGGLVIRTVPKAKLREEISRAVYFYKLDGGESEKAQHVPPWCVEAFHARGVWPGIPSLNGVVEHPILREDGSILSKPGYDPATGLFVKNSLEMQIPASPTREEAARACGEILEVFADFPIADDASKSGLLAAVLTPLAKFAYRGPSPLVLIDANTRGSGKTMIADAIATIVTGRSMSRMTYDPHEEEMRKRITALVSEGAELVLIDNIATTFGNASLDAAITGETWKDRVLGKTETVEKPLNVTWFATGNNVVIAADTARRTMRVRLESPLENPESRASTDFAHADLLEWVRKERARLLTAALTVLRAFVLAGRPEMTQEQWGSFEGWSRVVRDAVVWSGYTDPKETSLHEGVDIEAAALRGVLEAFHQLDHYDHGMSARELLTAYESDRGDIDEFRVAVDSLGRTRAGKVTTDSIGKMLRKFKGRVANGRHLTVKMDRKGVGVWHVPRNVLPGMQVIAGDAAGASTREKRNDVSHAHDKNQIQHPQQSPSSPAEQGEWF